MKRIITLIIIINKYINCIFSEEEGLKLYANEICSYHGTPIINGNNVTCICEYFYSKIDDLNQTQILNNIIQCYYHKKHKFIVLFFSIFLPFGLDYLYLERYLEFTLILLSYIFVIINQLICFFISNKFKGENIQEIQPKEKIDNKKIIEEEKEEILKNKKIEKPQNPIKIMNEDNYTNDIILEHLNYKNEPLENINDNVNLFQFTEEVYEDSNLYYLNEFHITSKNDYSTENEFEHLLNSQSSSQNKNSLVNRLLSLNERQWNKENMLISDSLKSIREEYPIMEISLFIKYCRKIITLHNHFNWLVWALGYYYSNSLLYYKRQWFTSKEWNLPPVEGMDWIRGFEWKGLFIKVIPYDKAKDFINEVKALNYAFLDFLQIIDCVKIKNYDRDNDKKKFLLSNELIFPLISYCVFNGIVFTVTVCVNKYSYDNDDGVFQGNNQKFDNYSNYNDILKKKNDSIVILILMI